MSSSALGVAHASARRTQPSYLLVKTALPEDSGTPTLQSWGDGLGARFINLAGFGRRRLNVWRQFIASEVVPVVGEPARHSDRVRVCGGNRHWRLRYRPGAAGRYRD